MIKKGENIYICKCDLRVANKICGVDIGESNILKLMNNEETDLIEGFKINDGSTFSAHIYINKNAYVPKKGKTEKALKFRSPNARSFDKTDVKC